MKKTAVLLLAVSLLLACACALAETSETCTYTVFNETGEKIVGLYVTDNLTGEKSENLVGEEGLAKGGIFEINGTNKEGYEITLSFVTESGYEAAFESLHFETVPLTLFSRDKVAENVAAAGPDAKSGATPLSFFAPVCTYTVHHVTGEKSENYAGEGLADGASVAINGTNKAGYAVTLSFKTESGYEAAFPTLHFETVPISLLSADALTGATPISFKAPQ